MIPPLRYAGLVAVATLWTTLGAGTVLTGFDLLGERPLSYLGTQHPSALLFSGGLLVAALALLAFHRHVRARYRVTTLFSVTMLVGLAGQAVAALVPIGGDGAGHRVHTKAALVLGASLPLLMWRFAASQPAGAWRRLTYGLFWVEAAAVAVGLHLSARMVAPVAEILPAAAFHLWIVAVTVSRTGIPAAAAAGAGADRDSGPMATGRSPPVSALTVRRGLVAAVADDPPFLVGVDAVPTLLADAAGRNVRHRRSFPSLRQEVTGER